MLHPIELYDNLQICITSFVLRNTKCVLLVLRSCVNITALFNI